MKKRYWLVCNNCGYSKEIFTAEEVSNDDTCPMCKDGQMILDMNAGRKITEPTGDNIPIFDREKQGEELKRLEKNIEKLSDIRLIEQEISNSINMIGNNATWNSIEAIIDVKLRLRYRYIFLKLGGTTPEE